MAGGAIQSLRAEVPPFGRESMNKTYAPRRPRVGPGGVHAIFGKPRSLHALRKGFSNTELVASCKIRICGDLSGPDRIGSGHITCSFGGMPRNGVFRLVPFTPLMAPFAVVIVELAFGSGMALGPPPAFAETSTWMVSRHSAAQCTLRHIVAATVSGEFDGPVCTVTFDPARLRTPKADVGFDTMSVNTRNADRAKDMRTRPVLLRGESLRR